MDGFTESEAEAKYEISVQFLTFSSTKCRV